MRGPYKLHAFFVLCMACFQLPEDGSAQDSLPPFPSPEWRLGSASMAGAIADFSANSSGLTAAFYEPFLFGGRIDRELKRKNLEGMEGRNRFGGDTRYSLGGSIEPDSLLGKANQERRIFFRLTQGTHYHSRFTRDLFRTVFIGNAGASTRLELAPFNLNVIRYRRFKVGILDQRGPFKMGIAISGIQGVSDLNMRSSSAHITNGDDPSELDLRLKGEFRQSGGEQPHRRPFSFSGSGIGMDIMAGYDFGTFGRVRFSLKNMGVIAWRERAETHRIDTNVRFRGIRVGDPFSENGEDGSFFENMKEKYLPEAERGIYRGLFPAGLHLSYSKRLPSGVWFRTRFRQRLFAAHAPFVSLEGIKEWEKFKLGPSIGYGGYGELALGLSAEMEFGERWSFYLRSQHLEGFIFPRSMGGIAARGGLHYSY